MHGESRGRSRIAIGGQVEIKEGVVAALDDTNIDDGPWIRVLNFSILRLLEYPLLSVFVDEDVEQLRIIILVESPEGLSDFHAWSFDL